MSPEVGPGLPRLTLYPSLEGLEVWLGRDSLPGILRGEMFADLDEIWARENIRDVVLRGYIFEMKRDPAILVKAETSLEPKRQLQRLTE